MSQHKFEIKLSGDLVSGRHFERTEVRQEFGPVPIATDPLTLRTAQLLEDWLNNWHRIARLNAATCNQLLSVTTLQTMGAHLWQLILNDDVGIGLINVAATVPGQRLRVVISIDGDVRPEIAGLPWEFLYYPGTGQRDGYFLAAKSDLVLTRYVNAQVPAIKPVQQTLRVLFLVVLPGGPKFAEDRVRIIQLAKRLPETCPVEVVTFIDDWDSAERRQLFSEDAKPFHVIHVVGLCRGTADAPEIYFPTGNTGQWVDADPLVDLLTRRFGERAAPGLVVLELSDDVDGDARESFERLAPSLIRAGTPAVLAMQYPLPSPKEGGFAEEFYKRLTKGMVIGEAVQEIRQQSATSRLLGTPVLYLHEDGALVRKAPPRDLPTARPSPEAIAGRAARIRKKFLARIDLADIEDQAVEQDLKDWVNATNWSTSYKKAADAVQVRSRQEQDKPELGPLFEALRRELSSLATNERGQRVVERTA